MLRSALRILDDKPCLAVVAGPISRRFFEIESEVLIGRAPEADICIYSDEVSRFHTKIGVDEDENLFIEDLGSEKGTLVNGQIIEKQPLRYGDTIQIAYAILVFVSSRLIRNTIDDSDRLESLGKLAGGVGHKFNNLMAVVLSNVSFLRNMALNGRIAQQSMLDALTEIESSASQAIDMTGQLLGFADLRRNETSATNISELITEVATLAQNIIDEKIKVKVRVEPELVVEGDRALLHTMLMNVCMNARDAMPDGGELHLKAGLEEMSEDAFPMEPLLSNDPWVVVTIRDTGTGINEEVCGRVFTPLFTTNLDGSTRGLGLTVVYGVIRAHNGYVAIESEPGAGTTFKIYLPAFEQDPALLEPSAQRATTFGEGRRILLIDDDPPVLRSTRRLLEQRGYDVICANNGQVALEIFREQGDHIDLVMLDLVMPIMDGVEAFGLLKEAREEVPVIISSGCSERDLHGHKVFQRFGKPVFLSKPFNQNALYEALERAWIASS